MYLVIGVSGVYPWSIGICCSKLRSNPCNPAFSDVFGTDFRRLSEARPSTLDIRMNQNILYSEINLNSIAIILTP